MSKPENFSVLRDGRVFSFVAGRFASSAARQMVGVAIGWELYERTHSAFALGMVGLVQIVPVVALAFYAGAVVDRTSRKRVVLVCEALMMLLALGLFAISRWQLPVVGMYALLFLEGIVRAFNSPAISSMLPRLVKREHFVTANAWSSSAFELASMGGPAIAGGLIAWLSGAAWVYVIVAALHGVFALLVLGFPPMQPQGITKQESKRTGLTFILNSPLLLSALTLDMFAVMLGGATALLPIFAKEVLHEGPAALGWLRAAPAMGAFTMAVITTHLKPWRKPGRVLLIVVAGFGFSTILFGVSRSFALSMVALCMIGAFDEVSVVIRLTLEQLLTPDHLRGRVSAVHYVFIGASNEFGAFESGLAASLLGPIGAVVFGGIGTLVVVAFVAKHWPVLLTLQPLTEIKTADMMIADGELSVSGS